MFLCKGEFDGFRGSSHHEDFRMSLPAITQIFRLTISFSAVQMQ